MPDLTALRDDMEIVGSDGRHVGEIDSNAKRATLSLSKDEAERRWRHG